MRPANPVSCVPRPMITPVYNVLPSVNTGTCGLPLVSPGTVVVVDAALMLTAAEPLSRTRNVLPAGLENCRLVFPTAAVICATIEAMPPVKLTPITLSLALAAVLGSGSAVGSSTRTMVIWCGVLVAVSV
ncbi:hypothetical protein ES703_124929 [subsurface metagenome]